ncbi:MAG: pitrilysin family protein [Methanomassiliicoccales archaeon]
MGWRALGGSMKAITNREEQLLMHRTPGGIPVIVDRLNHSRAAAVAVNISVGSRDERPEFCGIAHLLEHLLFKGTKFHTSKEINSIVEAAGGEMNGYTGKEITSYYIQTLDETINTAQQVLTEMVRHPLLDPKDVEMEKKVVMQEIKMVEDDPDGYIHELLVKAAWDGNPMANPEGGSIESVLAMRPDDIRQYFVDHYRPPYLSVVATGNVDAGQVLNWASRSFDDLAKSSISRERLAPVFHSGVKLFPRDGDQMYVGMGFPGLPAAHQDRYAQNLLSVILAAGNSSRLYHKIREENGLVYSIYSLSYPFTDCGLFSIFFSTSSDNCMKVLELIAEEIRNLKSKGLEKDELTRAKRWLKGMIVRKLEPVENRMFFHGEHFLQTGSLLTEEQMLQRLEMVKEEDVLKIVERMLNAGKLCLAIHASPEEGSKVARLAESLEF